MKTTTQILPGIRTLGWVDCAKLPRRVDLHGICRMPVAVLTDITPVDFFGEPECQCVTEKESGRSTDTATLRFRCPNVLPTASVALGFVVTDQRDKSWLIGCAEHPRPTIKGTIDFGTPGGDAGGYTYEVSHKALKSLVPCII